MLVELHSFSGYDNDAITPLPSPLIVLDVLKIVTSAQVDLDRKVISVRIVSILLSLPNFSYICPSKVIKDQSNLKCRVFSKHKLQNLSPESQNRL